MNTNTFWTLIENAQRKQEDGWIELDHNALIDALTQLPAEDIQEFSGIFFRTKANAYRADLWDAAILIECICSDDTFDDVQNWLIVQGREIYEKVLRDPDNLADIVPRKHRFDLIDVRIPEHDITIMGAAEVAYQRKTGELELAWYGYEKTPELIGKHMSQEAIQVKFPRIMEKLGQYSDEDVESTWLS